MGIQVWPDKYSIFRFHRDSNHGLSSPWLVNLILGIFDNEVHKPGDLIWYFVKKVHKAQRYRV